MPLSSAGGTATAPRISIRSAQSQDDIALTRALFIEYAESLDFSLCFQGFDTEMAEFPESYLPPDGCLLIASLDREAAGAVGLRTLHDGGSDRACEMKRLYVKPACRGYGVGELFVHRVIGEAGARGYGCIRLDTLPSMTSARQIYGAFGFVPIGNYNNSPMDGIEHFELDLSQAQASYSMD